MSKISAAIFEWDESDVELLYKAKLGELQRAGCKNPTREAVFKAVTKYELAKHCRRKTRGTDITTSSIEEVVSSFLNATDAVGVSLLREEVFEIWEEEKRHVKCLQDPENVLLYTKVDETSKGGVLLPVYRCARGSTSLESFHCHIKNFIRGIY